MSDTAESNSGGSNRSRAGCEARFTPPSREAPLSLLAVRLQRDGEARDLERVLLRRALRAGDAAGGRQVRVALR